MKKVLSPFLEHTDVCILRWCSNDVKHEWRDVVWRDCGEELRQIVRNSMKSSGRVIDFMPFLLFTTTTQQTLFATYGQLTLVLSLMLNA
jgi:hypothetical protein